MSHTKIPWQLEDDGTTIISPPNGRPYIEVVATKLHRHNAAFIVQAVNSFAAMKDACQTALDNLKPKYSSDHIVIRQLTNALALAEGKEG